MSVSPCCGIPNQQAAQYVGIADVVLGALNLGALAFLLKKDFDRPEPTTLIATPSSNYVPASFLPQQHQKPYQAIGTFGNIPIWLFVTIFVSHIVQFCMGFVLLAGALNRKRPILEFWLVITGFTALFTGLCIRIFEMVVVNKLAKEILQERNENTDPSEHNRRGRRPNLQQTYPNPNRISTISQNQNMNRDHNHHIPHHAIQMMPPPPYGYGLQYEPHNIPQALQPPPRYEDVVKDNVHQNMDQERDSARKESS